MTSIVEEGGKTIVERIINGILDESRYVLCFKCIVDDFEKEKPELEAKWRTVEKDVEDAKRNCKDIKDDVLHWQGEAKKLIDEDTQTKKPCFGGWCPNCIWRYRRGKQLSQMTEDIRRLREKNFASVGSNPDLRDVNLPSSQSFIPFESRVSEYKQLLDAIADENNYIIGLWGMGGAGKTTLAKEVGTQLKESGKFDYFIFATVSNDPDIKKIQNSLAGPLGLCLKDKDEWERPKTLWKRLTKDGEKILILLDDLWDEIGYEEIGIPSPGSHKNCKVLLTSRDSNVCRSMKCSNPIQLGFLSDQDAWLLFKKHANIDDHSSENIQDKGKEITNECKNLPFAIAVIASTLKDRPQVEWDAALASLRNPTSILEVNENMRKIYQCLKYSYDSLESEKVKRLFLLLSLFPEDSEVPMELLTRCGLGLGLFQEVDKYCEARSLVFGVKNKLIDSCLWLDANDNSVKVHDLVREVALWRADGDIQYVGLFEKNKSRWKKKKVKYLFCGDLHADDMNVFSSWDNSSELEMLFITISSDDWVNVSPAFFEKMTRLRVLSFTSESQSALLLPVSLPSLINVRSLLLSEWELGDISVLGTLRSLETLDLLDCSIREFPNEISKLDKLVLLNVRSCEIERNNPFEVIARCLQLEELYFTGNELGVLDTENEVTLIPQNTTFPTLNRYHLEDNVGGWTHLESKIVCFGSIDALISQETCKYLVQGAEILTLKEVEREWRNIIPDIFAMEYNSNLTELSLISCSKIQCLVNTKYSDSGVPNVFSKLIELNLEDMDNLEELCIGPLPLEFMRSLQRLVIEKCQNLQGMLFKSKLNLCNLKLMKLEKCPMLASLFHPSTARNLVLLEKLTIQDCGQLTNIITDEESQDNYHKGNDSLFPKLKHLSVRSCGRLECIFPALSPQDIPLLEEVRIVYCLELKHVFGVKQDDVVLGSTSSSLMRRSSWAKQQDPTTHQIFSWSSLCCYRTKYEPNLRNAKSIRLSRDSKVGNTKCSMSSGDCHGTKCNAIFPNLKLIEVYCCGQLEYLFDRYPWDHQDYKKAHIHFPALENFYLGQLPKFSICPNNSLSLTLPTLEEMRVFECPMFADTFLKDESDTKQLDPTITEDSRGSRGAVNLFLTRETLSLKNVRAKSILHEKIGIPFLSGHKVSLTYMELENLPQMTYICVGPGNSFSFPCLKSLKLVGCENLEIVFPASVLRFLPELIEIEIKECRELKQIVEENVENQKLSQQPCFPKLMALVVQQCHKLKRFIAPNDLPNLELLIIDGASELEELNGYEEEEEEGNNEIRKADVMLPKLKLVLLRDLSKLRHGLTTLHTARRRVVHNCPQLSFTSNISLQDLLGELVRDHTYVSRVAWLLLYNYIKEISNLSPSLTNEESKEDFVEKVASSEMPVIATSPTNSKSEVNDKSLPGSVDITPYEANSQTNEELEEEFVGEVDSSEIPATVTSLDITPYEAHSQIFEDHVSTREPEFLEQRHAPGETTRADGSGKERVQEVSNLRGKEGEKGFVSFGSSVTQRNERPKKEVTEVTSISEMPATAASSKDSDVIKGSSRSFSDIPDLPKTHSNELVDGISMGEACLTNHQKSLGETSVKRGVEGVENTKMATLSTHLDPGHSVTPLYQSNQHASLVNTEVRLNQMETCTNEESEGDPINIQDLRDDYDIMSLFQLEEEDGDGQIGTPSVSVVLAELEELLKMPLKDIASSEANRLCLLRALNFFSRLSLEHVTLSHGLKAIIDSLHTEFPAILRSFKQAFATTNKFAVLEEKEKSIKEELAHRKEVANSLVSKISNARDFMDELKEQMKRLEKEIKDCEVNLSLLHEEKKKFVADTIHYKVEFQAVRKDKSQMVEDQTKAHQELLEADHKWSILCSQFENSCVPENNPS